MMIGGVRVVLTINNADYINLKNFMMAAYEKYLQVGMVKELILEKLYDDCKKLKKDEKHFWLIIVQIQLDKGAFDSRVLQNAERILKDVVKKMYSVKNLRPEDENLLRQLDILYATIQEFKK